MKKLLALISLLTLLGTQVNAQTKIGDWDAIEAMPQGLHIWVGSDSSFGSHPCIFQRATDQHLICDSALQSRSGMRPRTYSLYRTTVHEVRVERYTPPTNNAFKDAAIGAGIGVALGLAIGGRNGTMTRDGSAVVLGGIFGAGGYAIGQAPPSRHSITIFRR